MQNARKVFLIRCIPANTREVDKTRRELDLSICPPVRLSVRPIVGPSVGRFGVNASLARRQIRHKIYENYHELRLNAFLGGLHVESNLPLALAF